MADQQVLPAACAAYDQGIQDVLILERDKELGGILNQCIHNGFGLHTFQEELTGPEYAKRYDGGSRKEKDFHAFSRRWFWISVRRKEITAMNRKDGLFTHSGESGDSCHGVQGTAARGSEYSGVSSGRYLFGRNCPEAASTLRDICRAEEVVILGSGDIGLIMARRMTLEGAKVQGGGRTDAIFRRIKAKYCPVSG